MSDSNDYVNIRRNQYKNLIRQNYLTDFQNLNNHMLNTLSSSRPVKITDTFNNNYPNTMNKNIEDIPRQSYITDKTRLNNYLNGVINITEPSYHNFILLGTNGNNTIPEGGTGDINGLITNNQSFLCSIIKGTERILLFTGGYYKYPFADQPSLDDITFNSYDNETYINYRLRNGELQFGTSTSSVFKDGNIELLYVTININDYVLSEYNIPSAYTISRIDESKGIYKINVKNIGTNPISVGSDSDFSTILLSNVNQTPPPAPAPAPAPEPPSLLSVTFRIPIVSNENTLNISVRMPFAGVTGNIIIQGSFLNNATTTTINNNQLVTLKCERVEEDLYESTVQVVDGTFSHLGYTNRQSVNYILSIDNYNTYSNKITNLIKLFICNKILNHNICIWNVVIAEDISLCF